MVKMRKTKVASRITAFVLMFAMLTGLLPAGRQEAAAATELNDPQVKVDATTGDVEQATWDCVWFGHYPQSSDGKGGFNNDPIKWRVLAVDGDEALLLADKKLERKKYNETYTDVTWETSTVRSWLNGHGSDSNKDGKDYVNDNFMDKAFTVAEQEAINQKTIENVDNPTTDKIFFLSIGEALESAYGFPRDNSKYSKIRAALNTEYTGGGGVSSWWLRDPGEGSNYRYSASHVDDPDGTIPHGNQTVDTNNAIRPALFLNLKSDLWTPAGTVSSNGAVDENNESDEDNRMILSYGGHKYQMFANSGLSWTEAKKQCESLGGHLVTISSQGEMDAIVGMFGKRPLNAYWIGLSRKNANTEWQWVTGENVGYTNWTKGEPNNAYQLGENYAHTYTRQYQGHQVGQWNDIMNTAGDGYYEEFYNLSNFGFICEWESAADLREPQLPVMTADDAKAFWGFLFNIPQDFKTDEFFENDILDDPVYRLLTGQYAPGSIEEESTRRAFMTIVDNQVVKLTDGAVKSQNFLRENLIKCLNKEIGTDPDATGMKGECQEIFDNIRKPFQEKLEDSLAGFAANGCGKKLSAETISNVRCGIDVGLDILALPDKIDTFVNRVEMGVSAAFLSINSELAGRYRYFGVYLDNRRSVESPEDLVFQTILDHNKLALKDDGWIGGFTTLIPGKKSWMECTDLIERWAETTYLICNDRSTEETKEPATEPSKPNVEPSSEPSTEPNTKPSTETEPSKELSTKPSLETTVAPSGESRPKSSTDSGTKSTESSQLKSSSSAKESKPQTIDAKSHVKTYGNKPFNLGAKAKTTLAYQSSDIAVATVDGKGMVTLKAPGKVVITIKAAATGEYKAAKKEITVTVKPKQTVLIRVASNKKGILNVNWKKNAKISGYQIVAAGNSKFTKGKKTVNIRKNKTTNATIKKLKSKKAYYVKVRAYKQVGKTKVYGAYSKVKKVKVK